MDMSKDDSHKPSAKVLQLGFNISVSGDPGTDFQIVLDEKGQNKLKSSLDELSTDVPALPETITDLKEVENMEQEVKSSQSGPTAETTKADDDKSSDSFKDGSIITEIKNTMQHFEKFSDHVKEIPRLKNRPSATSTPFADRFTSKTEANLIYPEYKPRRFAHLYDWQSKKEYFKGTVKPLPPDLFLKPLPAENYYKRVTRYFDLEPYRHYGSVDSLNKYESKLKSDRYESDVSDTPPGILKKSDSESGDKLSVSSADSVKDIKIYQSGGILIMQNFKETDVGKKEISDFSAKLIENCNRLKEEINAGLGIEEKGGNSSDEFKHSGKMVQFDLSDLEGKKSKSGDSSSHFKDESLSKVESSESTSDYVKKDTSPQSTFQSQDFPSLSTQENDSVVSYQPGTSPTFGTGDKKLEWDSGADVGYLNLDLSKENLSTIEKIVLKGLSSDGLSEKKVVFEKKPEPTHVHRSKFILERIPSDLVIEEITESQTSKTEENTKKKQMKVQEGGKVEELADDSELITEKFFKNEILEEPKSKGKVSYTDKSVNVNTLFKNSECQSIIRSESPSKFRPKSSPKVRKFKKKKPNQKTNITTPLKEKIDSIIDIARQSSRSSEIVEMGVPKMIYRKVEGKPELQDVELSREMEEIIVDQRFKIKNLTVCKGKEKSGGTAGENKKETKRPVSASSSSNNTVLNKEVEQKMDQTVQTNDCSMESIAIQAFSSQKSSDYDFKSVKQSEEKEKSKSDELSEKENEVKQKNKEKSKTEPEEEISSNEEKPEKEVVVSSKNIQAFGLNCSLPKQLSHPKESEGDKQNTKSTQFFGGSINSLPNYHANVATKVESCGRMPKILKPKKSLALEIIRLREENKKNLEKDSIRLSELKKKRDNENKENFITGKTSLEKSKKIQSEETKKEDASGKVLTSEVLREHGDSIDRNIIQEKYFQSQLKEIEKREMISKTTSMERKLEEKEMATIGCQYSPQSKDNSQDVLDKGISLELYDSSVNLGDEQDQELTEHSSPSTNQTAHGWVPKTGNSKQSRGVGRAISFEYLPGYLYESNGNLRQKIQSDRESNVASRTSSGSSISDQGKISYSEGQKDSEGRTTLILENSTANSHDSGPMKILDENLTQLNLVVSKLWEKDAQIQSITQSLLVNLWNRNGCGDCAVDLGDSQKSEEKKSTLGKSSKNDRGDLVKIVEKSTKEISIGCQTEEKSSISDPEILFEERKVLETRISKEKENQIKWIENEIYHLNILRGLLEKQNSKRRKKHSIHSIVSSDTKSEELGKVLADVRSPAVTPVYGVTVSLSKKKTEQESTSGVPDSYIDQPTTADDKKYKVAVSVYNTTIEQENNNIRPVDVQLIVKGNDAEEGDKEDSENENEDEEQQKQSQSLVLEDPEENMEKVQTVAQRQMSDLEQHQLQKLQQRQQSQEIQQQKRQSTQKQIEQRQTSQHGSMERHSSLPERSQGRQRRLQDQLQQRQRSQQKWVQSQWEQEQLQETENEEKEQEEQQQLPRKKQSGQSKIKESLERPNLPSQSRSSSKTQSLERHYGKGYSPVPQADMHTQFPSLERKLEFYPSTSVQTDFPSPERCFTCKQEACVCLDLSGRSFESGSHSSKKTSEKKESPKLSFEKNPSEYNKTDSLPESEFVEYKSNQASQRYEKPYKTASTVCSPKTKVIQISGCKCENRCRRVESRISKSTICRDPCQPNIYLNYERSDAGSCRCSKVQIQKSSCTCHIIKILNTKCCTENETYQKQQKKMENQFSQTDDVEVVVKNLVANSDVMTPSKGLDVSYPMENKTAMEKRQSIEKKYSANPKISYSKFREHETSIEVQEKEAVVGSQATNQQFRTGRRRIVGCKCTRSSTTESPSVIKKKQEIDNYPRHYFLRIEEKEVEEMNESVKPKNSLEVITVTVPFKVSKEGKSKPVEPPSDSYNEDFYNPAQKLCNCCEDCQMRAYELVPEEDEEFGEDVDWEPISEPEVRIENAAPSKYMESQAQPERPQKRFESRLPPPNVYEECRKSAELFNRKENNRLQLPKDYDDSWKQSDVPKERVSIRVPSPPRYEDCREQSPLPYKRVNTRVSSPIRYQECREQQQLPHKRVDPRVPSPTRFEECREQLESPQKRTNSRVPSPITFEECREQLELPQKRANPRVPSPTRFEECREQLELPRKRANARVSTPSRYKECREQSELPQRKVINNLPPPNVYEECWKQAALLDRQSSNQLPPSNEYEEYWKQSEAPQRKVQSRSQYRNKYEESQNQPEIPQKRVVNRPPPDFYEECLRQAGMLDDRSSNFEESWRHREQRMRRADIRVPKPEDYYYYEDDGTRGNEQSTSSVDCYPEKLSAGYSQSDSYYRPGNESSKSVIGNYREETPDKDIQAGYGGHRNNRSYYPGGKKKGSGKNRSRSYKQVTESSVSSSKYDVDSSRYDQDYYNYNKKEYMTKSELMKERRTKNHQLPLKEYLATNRPDFYSNAEARRQIISERSKERMRKHNARMECLMNLIHHCNESDPLRNSGPKRMFTTAEMREQTMKRYRKLPEVTGKLADEKKKEEYKTNKIMADVFAKKLQLQALKGHLNLSNSVSVLSII